MNSASEVFYTRIFNDQSEILELWLNARREVVDKLEPQESLFSDALPEILKYLAEYVKSENGATGIKDNINENLSHDLFRKILISYDMDVLVEELILLKQIIKHYLIENKIYELHLQEKVSDFVLHVVKTLSTMKNDIFKTTIHDEISVRENFVLSLTHDLRGPLAAAKMNAQILERKNKEPDVLKYVPKVIDNINRCDELVSNILDAKKIRLGEKISLNKVIVNSTQVIKECIEELRASHGDRFSVEVDDFEACWDVSAVKRIIINLASNAVKYGDETKRVTIAVKPEDNVAKITVHNFGKPIPREDQEIIFEQYKRLADGLEKKGWGLGLTLVKGLAEAHGGVVGVSSNQGQGTMFTVTLPLDPK